MIIISGCGCLLDILCFIGVVIVWILEGFGIALLLILSIALIMAIIAGVNALYRKLRGKDWKEGKLIKKINKIKEKFKKNSDEKTEG